MTDWTHSSSWRLCFSCKAPANTWAPSLIWFPLRLQNVREWEMRVGSTTLSIWSQYLTTETQYQTLCNFLSVSEVEDYKLCGWETLQASPHPLPNHGMGLKQVTAHFTVHCLRSRTNCWTHLSLWRLWLTRKALLSARTPSLIWFLLRLQNVKEQEIRGGSTDLFTSCKVYLVSYLTIETQYQTLCHSLSVSEVEDYSL